jgi:SAM-dependent methyltransferase
MGLLPKNGRILDLGCGPGRDAKVFADQRFHVIGIDFSPTMIAAARACAPQVTFHVMDIESLDFPPNSFDGVWANCSLLHVPKRSIPAVLQNIAAILKSKGIFYLALKLGDAGEVLEKDTRYNGAEKFWSYFEQEELAGLLADAGFIVLEQEIIQPSKSYDTHPHIKILASKTEKERSQ